MTDESPNETTNAVRLRAVTEEYLAIDIEKSIKNWLEIHGDNFRRINIYSPKDRQFYIVSLARKIAHEIYPSIIERRVETNDRRKHPRGGRREGDPRA